MLPHDRSNRGGGGSSSSSSSSSSSIIRSVSRRDSLRRASMAAESTINRRKRGRLLLVYAFSFLGAAVVVFIAGGYRKHNMGPPSQMDAPAGSSAPATGFRSSPPGESDSQESTTGPSPTSSGSFQGGVLDGVTATGSTGDEGAELGPTPKPAVEMTNRASGQPHPDRVAVYVYDGIPELDHSDLVECYREKNGGVAPWQDEQADMAQDMGEIWLHRALLAHPWRVLDPEEADVFFVPIYPVLSMKLALAGQVPCGGLAHYDRMTIAVDYLVRSSLFFNRFGGADHVVVCAWWNCRMTLNPTHRMLLRRTVVGINERNYGWTWWGCGNSRTLTVPYTASSVLTTSDMIGGLPASDRDIPFFFVGTARGRPERQNLDAVMGISNTSIILLGGDGHDWGMNSTEYAAHMSRSRFCFCPRGDTPSSRRLFDAIAAGCIPIVTETGVAVLPFSQGGLNYSEFAMIVDESAFSSREGVEKVTRDALARSETEREELLRRVKKGASTIVYGITRGPNLEDMRPSLDTATEFLKEASVLTGEHDEENVEEGDSGGMWSCPETNLSEKQLAARASSTFPPPQILRRQWLAETETIVNKERSLLFCAPPNTGSLQFRMLAKRMQGISHWSVHDDRSLLFDREASELELLDIADKDLLTAIYRVNGSGWIKIGVVRDPVTRLLSAYLSLVKTWQAGLRQQPFLSGDAEDEAGAPTSQHDRQLRQDQRHDEALDEEGRPLGQARGKGLPLGVGTKSEWDLFDAVVDKRRRHQRQRRLRERQEGEKEAHAGEGEGFHQSEGGGRSGRSAAEERGAKGGGGGAPTEVHRPHSIRPTDASQLRRQPQRSRQRRRATVFEDEIRNDGEPGDGVDSREALFWEGPGGWSGPVGAAAAADRTAGIVESDYGVDDGGDDDRGVAAGIPTFLEVLDTLKAGIWNAPVAFRPAVSMCGQRNSPFDTVIPFERLQASKTSTEVLKSLPGGVWEAFGASGWGPDGKHAFMEFDYGEAASAWRSSSSSANEEAGMDVNDDLVTPLPHRARDLFDGEDPCAWVEFYGSLETLEEVGRLYEMDYKYYRWYRLDPWRERLQNCL
ncbi:unnamed protein product [Scytosiphon promiscuus]